MKTDFSTKNFWKTFRMKCILLLTICSEKMLDDDGRYEKIEANISTIKKKLNKNYNQLYLGIFRV